MIGKRFVDVSSTTNSSWELGHYAQLKYHRSLHSQSEHTTVHLWLLGYVAWIWKVIKVNVEPFLQRVSIAYYAERCISYDRFCPTVCHSPVSCQNDSSYDHAVFTGG